ncbi:exported hypothetical protein [Cupriavidus necator]|uniref:Uncharacterized protein n=1 Tax=Cupriavidus necator TaxID=106590 RepID=A0A1K0JDV4_CUPNE|nr:exported hypothetical protein [Cupriavidus necator]
MPARARQPRPRLRRQRTRAAAPSAPAASPAMNTAAVVPSQPAAAATSARPRARGASDCQSAAVNCVIACAPSRPYTQISPPGSLQKRSRGQALRMACGAPSPQLAPALRRTWIVTSGCRVSCSGMAASKRVTLSFSVVQPGAGALIHRRHMTMRNNSFASCLPFHTMSRRRGGTLPASNNITGSIRCNTGNSASSHGWRRRCWHWA